MMVALLAAVMVAAPAGADHNTSLVPPQQVSGNPTCSDFHGGVEYKLEPVSSGVKTIGDFTVDVTVKNTSKGQVFDYQILSNHIAHGVVVKGGPVANHYDYEAAGLTNVKADVDLHSPENPRNGSWYGLSHISWCAEEGPIEIEATLNGRKYLDQNENGAFDVGEALLDGWKIRIYDYTGGTQGSLIVELTTANGGEWTYTTDPIQQGDTLELLVCEEQRTGWQQTGPVTAATGTTLVNVAGEGTCYAVSLTAGDNDVTIDNLDFGNIVALVVDKTAATEFTRTWTWEIDKDADQTQLNLQEGQTATVNYTVEVKATSADSAHRAFGTIVVTNPSTVFSASITAVSDNQADSVDCGVAFPYTLAPGASLTCNWTKATSVNGTNTATVTATGGFAGGTATASWDFASATITQVDRCVTVSDTHQGSLGTVCAPSNGAPFSHTFNYSLTIGNDAGADVFADCGRTVVDNTATFVTNTTGTQGSDDHTVIVDVECVGEGCTPGFWRQSQHLHHWEAAGLSPSASYDTTFGVTNSISASLTLYEAVWLGGGGESRLLRHSTAALLNASHPDVDYEFSAQDVIDLVQWAYATGNFNAAADQLEAANEAGCPL